MGVVWGGTFAVQRMQNKMLRLWGRLSWKGERLARLPIPAPHKIGMALHAKEIRKWRWEAQKFKVILGNMQSNYGLRE